MYVKFPCLRTNAERLQRCPNKVRLLGDGLVFGERNVHQVRIGQRRMQREQFLHRKQKIAFAANRQHGRANFANAGARVTAGAVVQPQSLERFTEAVEVGLWIHRLIGGDLRAHVFAEEGGLDGGVELARIVETFRLPAGADSDEFSTAGLSRARR